MDSLRPYRQPDHHGLQSKRARDDETETLGTATQAAMNTQGTPDPAAAPQPHGPPRSALTTAPPPSTAARPGARR
eukprot:16447411-Heterocapsa_arctica.AAC.1